MIEIDENGILRCAGVPVVGGIITSFPDLGGISMVLNYYGGTLIYGEYGDGYDIEPMVLLSAGIPLLKELSLKYDQDCFLYSDGCQAVKCFMKNGDIFDAMDSRFVRRQFFTVEQMLIV